MLVELKICQYLKSFYNVKIGLPIIDLSKCLIFFRTLEPNMLCKNQAYPSYATSLLVNLMRGISNGSEDVCELGMVSKNIIMLVTPQLASTKWMVICL